MENKEKKLKQIKQTRRKERENYAMNSTISLSSRIFYILY